MNATKNQNYHIFCLKTIFVSLAVGAGCCRIITGLLGRNPGPELTQQSRTAWHLHPDQPTQGQGASK